MHNWTYFCWHLLIYRAGVYTTGGLCSEELTNGQSEAQVLKPPVQENIKLTNE